MVNDIAICAGGSEFGFQVGQNGRSIAIGSPPLRRFFGVVLPTAKALCHGDGPRHSLHASA